MNNDAIVITIIDGGTGYEPAFIQMIEKSLEEALNFYGFARTSKDVEKDVTLHYYQFARAERTIDS